MNTSCTRRQRACLALFSRCAQPPRSLAPTTKMCDLAGCEESLEQSETTLPPPKAIGHRGYARRDIPPCEAPEGASRQKTGSKNNCSSICPIFAKNVMGMSMNMAPHSDTHCPIKAKPRKAFGPLRDFGKHCFGGAGALEIYL